MEPGKRRVGITSYGTYIPRHRMMVEESVRVWENALVTMLKDKTLVSERVVLAPDEDTITMAVEAGRQALSRWNGTYRQLGGLFLGTCTNPYDSRPSATLVAEALGDQPWLSCADVQFSTRSGTAALQVARAMVASGAVASVMAIGSDAMNRHAAPGTLPEYAASAGAGALIVGDQPDDIVAELGPFTTFCSDLSDAFRLEGERYIRSGGTAAVDSGVGLFRHVAQAVRRHLGQHKLEPHHFTHVVFQQPFGVSPIALASRLGFRMEQVQTGLVAYELGDLGSASVLVALAAVLDRAHPGDTILVAAYGFGAGADVATLRVTPAMERFRRTPPTVERQIQHKVLVDYATAMKYEGKYAKAEHSLTAWL
jgi:2-acetylphloroglucinol acetyltransferase